MLPGVFVWVERNQDYSRLIKMTNHGGSRSGAGRKRGAASKKTREVADKAIAKGITPLEVMLSAMRQAYQANNLKDAAGYAKDAAPYIHPRLSSVAMQANATISFAGKSEQEIDEFLSKSDLDTKGRVSNQGDQKFSS